MASTRAQLYVEVCDFLKEPRVAPGAAGAVAPRIAGQETSAALWLLGSHNWNFASATQRLTLAATADADAEEPDASLSGYLYAYHLPAITKTNWVSSGPSERDRLTAGRDWTDKGGRILSRFNPLYIDAVLAEFATEAKIGYWPPLFLTAVASLIADRLTGPVTNSRGWASDMSQRSEAVVEDAKIWDAGQAPAPRRRGGSWLRSRRGWRGSGEELQ